MDNKRTSKKEYRNKFSESKERKMNSWRYLAIGIDAILALFGIGEEGKD